MCWCTPKIRTPWCGKPECHPPTGRHGIGNKQRLSEAKRKPVKVTLSDGALYAAVSKRDMTPDEQKALDAELDRGASDGEG